MTDGYIKDDRIFKTFALKNDFKKGEFYKNVKVWKNKRIDNPHRKKKSLEDLSQIFIPPYKVSKLELVEQGVGFDKEDKPIRANQSDTGLNPNYKIKVKKFEKHIFRKAINIKAGEPNSIFQFRKLKEELKIEGIDDLQKSNFLGNFDIPAILPDNLKYEDLPADEKLNMVLNFLKVIGAELVESINPAIGTEEFYPYSFEELFGTPKRKSIDETNLDDTVSNENVWYVLDGFVGTDQERGLIDFIKTSMGVLNDKYEEVFLLRNEEVYTIYDFQKGRGFCPDFILFLKSSEGKNTYYQIFIEPKGEHLMEKDKWKEDFLLKISKLFGNEKTIAAENKLYRLVGIPFFNKSKIKNYHLLGLPFYNNANSEYFEEEFEHQIIEGDN